MLPGMPPGTPPANRMVFASAVAVICVIALNALFYFLSDSYFGSHLTLVGGSSVRTFSPDQESHIRMLFAVTSVVTAALALVATLSPRAVGHLAPVALSLLHLAGAMFAYSRGAPGVLGAVLLISGGLMPVLSWHSMRGSRPAWAFLVALCGTFAVVELFGAPKIAAATGLSLWTAMLMPSINAVIVSALVALRGEYTERDVLPA